MTTDIYDVDLITKGLMLIIEDKQTKFLNMISPHIDRIMSCDLYVSDPVAARQIASLFEQRRVNSVPETVLAIEDEPSETLTSVVTLVEDNHIEDLPIAEIDETPILIKDENLETVVEKIEETLPQEIKDKILSYLPCSDRLKVGLYADSLKFDWKISSCRTIYNRKFLKTKGSWFGELVFPRGKRLGVQKLIEKQVDQIKENFDIANPSSSILQSMERRIGSCICTSKCFKNRIILWKTPLIHYIKYIGLELPDNRHEVFLLSQNL